MNKGKRKNLIPGDTDSFAGEMMSRFWPGIIPIGSAMLMPFFGNIHVLHKCGWQRIRKVVKWLRKQDENNRNSSVKHRKMPESVVALRKMVFSILHISMVYTDVNSSRSETVDWYNRSICCFVFLCPERLDAAGLLKHGCFNWIGKSTTCGVIRRLISNVALHVVLFYR